MAKHFTDTRKWKDPWFFALTPRLKLAWLYICDDCDGAGVWKINMDLLNISIDKALEFPIAISELENAFGARVIRVKNDALWIPQFIRFQYKTLSPRSPAARGLMRQIVEATDGLTLDAETEKMIAGFKDSLRPSTNPQPTPSRLSVDPDGKGKGNGDGKGEGEGKGKGEGNARALSLREQIRSAYSTWLETLAHFKIPARDISPADESALVRALGSLGLERVRLALEGQRYEPKTEKFDPKDHLSLERVLGRSANGKTRHEQFANLALAARERKARSESARDPRASIGEVTVEHADPAKIRELANSVKKLGGG